jgi:hypothetical protein
LRGEEWGSFVFFENPRTLFRYAAFFSFEKL